MQPVKACVIKLTSGLIAGLLPPLHVYILYKFWGKYSRRVDKRYCSCSCWDTVFKGSYESGIGSYKHIYFNATANTMKIWLMTVVCLIILYESFKYEVKLWCRSQLRASMAMLFLTSVFPHYYSWWVYVNYWNDDFYSQWNHQLFFTVTEIISTMLVLHLSNSEIPLSIEKVLTISSIALIHLISGGLDQFVRNIVLGEGYPHQVIRDVSFIIPDVLHVVFPLMEFLKYEKKNNALSNYSLKKKLLYMLVITAFGFLISFIL